MGGLGEPSSSSSSIKAQRKGKEGYEKELGAMTVSLNESAQNFLQMTGCFSNVAAYIEKTQHNLRHMFTARILYMLHLHTSKALWPQLVDVLGTQLGVIVREIVKRKGEMMVGIHDATQGGAASATEEGGRPAGPPFASKTPSDIPVLSDHFECFYLFGAGASIVEARQLLAQQLDVPEDRIFGADLLNVKDLLDANLTNFSVAIKRTVQSFITGWQEMPPSAHQHSDTENFDALVQEIEGEGAGGEGNCKGNVYVFYDLSFHLKGFQACAAAWLKVARPNDVIILLQRIGANVDHYIKHHAQAFLATGSCRVEKFETAIPIRTEGYSIVVLLSTVGTTTSASDNGSGLLGKDMASIESVIAEFDAFAAEPRWAIIYQLGGWGRPPWPRPDDSPVRQYPAPTEEQLDKLRKFRPDSLHTLSNKWAKERMSYIGMSTRRDWAPMEIAKQRGKEHWSEIVEGGKNGGKHHSVKAGDKLKDMLVMELVSPTDPMGIQAGLFEEVKVPEIDEGAEYPLMVDYGGHAGSLQVVGLAKKWPGEQMQDFVARVSDMEQKAIDVLRAEGNLLNTLTVTGIYDSFACAQGGAQKAAQQGFEALKSLDVPREELKGKINKDLYQDLVVYGKDFVKSIKNLLVEKEKAEK